MKCNYGSLYIIKYFEGELSTEDKQKFEEHLKECEKCASMLSIYEALGEHAKKEEEIGDAPVEKIIGSIQNPTEKIISSIQKLNTKKVKKKPRFAFKTKLIAGLAALIVISVPVIATFLKDGFLYNEMSMSEPFYNYAGSSDSAAREKSAEYGSQSEDKGLITGNEQVSINTTNLILSQRKIIRNGFVTIEVDDFDTAYADIRMMTAPHGYIEESNITREKVYSNSEKKYIRKGTIVIRVAQDRFDSIFTNVKGLGTVFEEKSTTDDVTAEFFDKESRLRVLKIEQELIENHLKGLTNLNEIFQTQQRLTDIRYEIETLTGDLKKLSALVDLSTIRISISEKLPGQEPETTPSYIERLGQKFSNSFNGFFVFCGDVLLALIGILPALLFISLIIFIAVRLFKKYNKNKSSSDI